MRNQNQKMSIKKLMVFVVLLGVPFLAFSAAKPKNTMFEKLAMAFADSWSGCLASKKTHTCEKTYKDQILKSKVEDVGEAVALRKKYKMCTKNSYWKIHEKLEGSSWPPEGTFYGHRFSICEGIPAYLVEDFLIDEKPKIQLTKYDAYLLPSSDVGVLTQRKKGKKTELVAKFPEGWGDNVAPSGKYVVVAGGAELGEVEVQQAKLLQYCENDGGIHHRYESVVKTEIPFKIPSASDLNKTDGVFAFLVKKGTALSEFKSKANKKVLVLEHKNAEKPVLQLQREATEADCSADADGESLYSLDVQSAHWSWSLRCCGP